MAGLYALEGDLDGCRYRGKTSFGPIDDLLLFAVCIRIHAGEAVIVYDSEIKKRERIVKRTSWII